MLRLKPKNRLLLVLACVLSMGVPVSGAHMHVCLEGAEPAVALHIESDVADHHAEDHHAGETHVQVDVSLAGYPLVKKAGVDHDLSALQPSTSVLYLLPLHSAVADFPEICAPAVRAGHFLMPPLRGPPV